MSSRPRYTLGPGRTIEREGVPIAYVMGVSAVMEARPSAQPYTLGLPMHLDAFAHEIVAALNTLGQKAIVPPPPSPCPVCGSLLLPACPNCDDRSPLHDADRGASAGSNGDLRHARQGDRGRGDPRRRRRLQERPPRGERV